MLGNDFSNSTTASTGNATSSRLFNLPTELKIEIFEHLDAVSSTCLGLTCNDFYSIYKKLHYTVFLVDLYLYQKSPLLHGEVALGILLQEWAGNAGLEYRQGATTLYSRRDWQEKATEVSGDDPGVFRDNGMVRGRQ